MTDGALDGAAIISMLTPRTAKTFLDFVYGVSMQCVTSQLQIVDRLDIICDLYMVDSLKNETRRKIDNGVRRQVEPASVLECPLSLLQRL